MAGAAEESTVPTKADGIYCIKCRDNTEDLEPYEGQLTSKGQPRSLMKATYAVCSKRKNRFSKTAKAEGESTVGIANTEQVGLVEHKVKKQRETNVLKKNLLKNNCTSLLKVRVLNLMRMNLYSKCIRYTYSRKPHIISLASPTYSGGDIVSTVSKLAKQIGVPLKNLHLPWHKFTGQMAQVSLQRTSHNHLMRETSESFSYHPILETVLRNTINCHTQR